MQLKFRARHPDWEEPIYSIIDHDWFAKREFYPFEFSTGFSHYPKDRRWRIELWTGLCDKKGKEIYLNDICLDEFGNKWSIDWSDEYAGFELSLVYSPTTEFPKLNICLVPEMEVIGSKEDD